MSHEVKTIITSFVPQQRRWSPLPVRPLGGGACWRAGWYLFFLLSQSVWWYVFGGCLQPEIALSLYLGHVWPAAGEPPAPRGGLNALTCNLQPEQQRQQTSSFPYYETRGVSCGDFSISLLLLQSFSISGAWIKCPQSSSLLSGTLLLFPLWSQRPRGAGGHSSVLMNI